MTAYARALVAFRTLAFVGLGVAIAAKAPLTVLVAAGKLPRALGIAATANEFVFVIGPVFASAIGGVSVIASVSLMAAASALPLVMPLASHTAGIDPRTPGRDAAGCDGLAVRRGQRFGLRGLDRGRRRGTDAAPRARAECGVPLHGSAIAGAVLIGLFLAPLGTAFSLYLEDVLPPARRAEGFALLRTSNAAGLITASSVIAFGSLAAAFAVAAVLAAVSAIVIAAYARNQLSAAR